MTYTPDYIRLSTNPDVLSSGAQRINANFDDISMEGNPITIQQILEVDPNAKLFRIGFTEGEVAAAIAA
jgi:hypothetical protein